MPTKPEDERSESPDSSFLKKKESGDSLRSSSGLPGCRDQHTTALVRRLSNSVTRTEQIAAELARGFQGGECVALNGELGAGKTQFVRGLVLGLDGNGRSVSSPTFVLLNIYQTPRLTLYHLDAYRVAGPEDFEAIGFAELLEQGGVVVIEWASRVATLLPRRHIEVSIETLSPRRRQIDIRMPGIRMPDID
jgi:tRNA threonylcarbamoyladenosine biosynthesis protein TsaE